MAALLASSERAAGVAMCMCAALSAFPHAASRQPTAVTTLRAWQVLPRFSQHGQVILDPGRALGHALAHLQVCFGCPCRPCVYARLHVRCAMS